MKQRSRKKNRRLITVDGQVYGWRVKGDDGFIDLFVWKQRCSGQRLRVRFHYFETMDSHRLISPRAVRSSILTGLHRGWNPEVKAPPFFCIRDGDNLFSESEWLRTVPSQKDKPN